MSKARPATVLVRTRRARMWLAMGTSLTIIAATAIATWALWPRPAASPHARTYLDVTACLLTAPSGIAPGAPAATVWAAMQTASLATHVMVSYLPETAPADATDMLSTLAERRCGVIIATGTAASPVIRVARAHPRQRFLLVTAVGTPAAKMPANAVVVSAADAPGRIDQVIRALAAAT
jgi:hypothetical protein